MTHIDKLCYAAGYGLIFFWLWLAICLAAKRRATWNNLNDIARRDDKAFHPSHPSHLSHLPSGRHASVLRRVMLLNILNALRRRP
jgi:hypothetical protein